MESFVYLGRRRSATVSKRIDSATAQNTHRFTHTGSGRSSIPGRYFCFGLRAIAATDPEFRESYGAMRNRKLTRSETIRPIEAMRAAWCSAATFA